jgi:hypothetical protein
VIVVVSLQVREHIRLAWETEKRICSLVWGLGEIGGRLGLDTSGKSFSMFFLQTLLVTPNKFRPPNMMNGDVSTFFHRCSYTGFYVALIQAAFCLQYLRKIPTVRRTFDRFLIGIIFVISRISVT